MIRASLILTLFCATPVVAQNISLSAPLDCEIGETCFIQQYVDNDPGPDSLDFSCGTQANDGHRGTDFRVATWAEMRAGVDVMAAAPGRVRATRDSMADIPSNAPNAPDITGRECGNAVVIDHADGWQTTYCHLKRGSVAVRSGDQIETGALLGQIGASGSTHFPHVHLTLRKDGDVVDPFRPNEPRNCEDPASETLWSAVPEIEFGGLLSAGFDTKVPEFNAIKDGLDPVTTLSPDAPALVIWTYLYATQTGDVLELIIEGPEGWRFANSETFEKGQAQLFRAGGRRQPEGGFPKGRYKATILHTRNDQIIDQLSRDVEITN